MRSEEYDRFHIPILGPKQPERTERAATSARFDIPILGLMPPPPTEPPPTVEVCRSFSYKINMENKVGPKYKYESADFFCSRKMVCDVEAAGWVSQELFEDCVSEVRDSAVAFITSIKQKDAGGPPPPQISHPGAARNYEAWQKKKGE